MLRDRLLDRMTWLGGLLALATAVVLLFGPLWDTAIGENPLTRDPDPDIPAVLRLALPSVVVMAAFAVAISVPRWRVAGAVALAVMGLAVWAAPPVLLWFLPALLLTAVGYVVSLVRTDRRALGR